MDERNGGEKMEDIIMLPGFRFHPTDEELVGFYLKKKTQQRTLSIELIKQLDIYKYDPWDLPKLASSTGEKEWYFYCPRDRKYKNSTRPNRVTGSGFWKATGTDRPIYSCEGSKCIGLKKSLVFYKGRAAKGLKTDWMMHEFRLPSTTNAGPSKPNDSWAICRIFKKASSVTQRALSHARNRSLFGSDSNYILSTARESSMTQYSLNAYDLPHSYVTNFCPLDQVANSMNLSTSNVNAIEQNQSTNSTADALLKTSSSVFGDFGGVSESLEYSEMQALYDSCSVKLPQEYVAEKQHDVQWEDVNFNVDLSEFGFGFLECDSSSTCPSEISATYYSTN